MPRRASLQLLLLATAVQLAAGVPCHEPRGEWITGADLTAAVPAIRAIPPDVKASYAPVPGLMRVFHPDELRRFAKAHGLPDPVITENVCFAWRVAPASPTVLRAAMENALAGHDPQIEIVAQSNAGIPTGEVIFPLQGLSAYSENPVLWKGYVRYTGNRRFDIWASVRVRVHETHLKAQGAIRAGERIAAGQWRAESYSGPPLRENFLSSGAQLDGLVARRDLADGAPLLAIYFEPPKAVERGDTVTVFSGAGAAHIEAPGEALAAGMSGDVILIRNPRSNRTFKARVTAHGQVEAIPGTSGGLVAENKGKGTL